MDNHKDYDNDGNNIVPCPICLSVHCPSKEGGKCPEQDEFVKAMSTKTWQEGFDEEFPNFFENYYYTKDASSGLDTDALNKDIKQFISDLRKGDMEALIEMLPEITPGYTPGNPIYYRAVNDIKSLIKQYYEN